MSQSVSQSVDAERNVVEKSPVRIGSASVLLVSCSRLHHFDSGLYIHLSYLLSDLPFLLLIVVLVSRRFGDSTEDCRPGQSPRGAARRRARPRRGVHRRPRSGVRHPQRQGRRRRDYGPGAAPPQPRAPECPLPRLRGQGLRVLRRRLFRYIRGRGKLVREAVEGAASSMANL